MKRSTKVVAAILMAAGLTFSLSRGGVPAMAEADSFSEGQVKSIEKIVKARQPAPACRNYTAPCQA